MQCVQHVPNILVMWTVDYNNLLLLPLIALRDGYIQPSLNHLVLPYVLDLHFKMSDFKRSMAKQRNKFDIKFFIFYWYWV